MRIAQQSILTVLALLTTVFVAIGSAMSMAVALAATVLIVPGTGTPKAGDVTDYTKNALNYYVAPSDAWAPSGCTDVDTCTRTPIDYPAQFWPIPLPGWGGLSGAKWDVSTGKGLATLQTTLDDTLHPEVGPPNEPIVIFGYSQGGNIVSREKRALGDLGANPDHISFVMIGNTNRPNGGLFERLALLGHVPILDATFGLPAPTKTCTNRCATDIAFEYDGVADFPLYPLNLLADLNAIAGFWYIHGTYLSPDGRSDPGELPDGYTPDQLSDEINKKDNWSDYGDTRYITIPTKTLPLVRPLLEFGGFTHTSFIVKPIVDLLEPVLRVLIDTGYDRSLSPGVPAPFRLIPLNINPIKLAGDVVKALGQGVKAALGDIGIKAPAPTPVSTTNLATAKTAAEDTPKTVVDNKKTADTAKLADTKTTDTKVTDTKTTDSKTTDTDSTPATPRPKVRGPIGSGPLAQLVRQFHDVVTGKHGTKSGDTTKTGSEPEGKPTTKPEEKSETPSTTGESTESESAKDTSATAKAAA